VAATPPNYDDQIRSSFGGYRIMPTKYDAQILKLRLPEQDSLKNEAERCSADPVMLNSLGRAVGHQVRIRRKDVPGFFAVYTVKEANPPADSHRPNVIRTGQAGRERLGATLEMEAVVQATVVDAAPLPGEPSGVRFFEVAVDNGKQAYLIAIAPHGGAIEEHTDEEAEHVRHELVSKGYPASAWTCRGYGDELKAAFDRWHITSTDLHPASFPLLQRFITRNFCYGLAFHGFSKRPGEADIYIGGRASNSLKTVIKDTLDALNLPMNVRIATTADDPKFQGSSADNIINRLAGQGVHIEQSAQARRFSQEIANAIVTVYRSRWRMMLCAWMQLLRRAGIASNLRQTAG
jgi:phage replication-related protein YjqB (UPF0714/DUF867 family)